MPFDFQDRPSRKPGSSSGTYTGPTSSSPQRSTSSSASSSAGSSSFSGDSSRFAPSSGGRSPSSFQNPPGRVPTGPSRRPVGFQPNRKPVSPPRPQRPRPSVDWERIIPILIALVTIAVVIAAIWYYRGAISAFLDQMLAWVFQIILIIVLIALIIRVILRLLCF